MKLDVIRPSYISRSTINNNSELINWYIEQDNYGGMFPTILMPSPGTDTFSNTGSHQRVRGLHNYNGTCYGVSDNVFFSVNSSGTVTNIGTLLTSNTKVQIASIQDQIMIVDNLFGYIYTVSTNTFTQIADADFPNGTGCVTAMNGRFIVNKPNTDQVFYSDLRNGLAWQAINFYRAESLQDDVVSVWFAGAAILFFGKFTTEIWVADTGGTTNFLINMPGTYIDYGCAAPYTVCQLENSLFWLTQNRTGQGEILQVIDINTRVISTPAVAHAISQYEDISDAFAYVFQEKGHKFYRITFPSAFASQGRGVTWDYDITTEQWNKALRYDRNGDTRHLSNCYTFCYGKHLVGSYTSGIIYEMSSDYYDDNGIPIRRLWQFPLYPNTENRRTTVYNLELIMERGVGLTTGQGENPQIMFQFSKDGGHSWMNERWRTPGRLGEFYKRAFWTNAGSGFIPYGRVMATDPVPWIIVGATANIQPEFKE